MIGSSFLHPSFDNTRLNYVIFSLDFITFPLVQFVFLESNYVIFSLVFTTFLIGTICFFIQKVRWDDSPRASCGVWVITQIIWLKQHLLCLYLTNNTHYKVFLTHFTITWTLDHPQIPSLQRLMSPSSQ